MDTVVFFFVILDCANQKAMKHFVSGSVGFTGRMRDAIVILGLTSLCNMAPRSLFFLSPMPKSHYTIDAGITMAVAAVNATAK